ncbi:MAG: prolipoprotein diacylglyceryl transferase [Clostridia bacterium]|nr:prolipoprotein diacylglyceryl transferase [Clostridia bacterium]
MSFDLFGVVTVRMYAILIVTGMVLAVLYMRCQEKRLGLPKDTALDMALWAIPAGIIGARLYYVAFTWDLYAPDPLSILKIWNGGLAIYGGIIGGFLGVLFLSRKKKLPLMKLMDMAAPAVILGQAVGRWGNFFNGEAYGRLITDPKWCFFPYGVQVDGAWYQATFFYESVWDLLGFLLLHLVRKKMRADGDLLFLYFVFYGVGRAFIEGLRSDSLWWGPFRVSQVLSLALAAAGLAVLAVRERNAR